MNPPPSSGFWTPSAWYLAQVVHLLAGPAVLFAAHIHGWEIVWTAIVFILATATKEFGLDVSPSFEGDSWQGSRQDFFFYQWGLCAASLTLAWFWIGVSLEVLGILTVFAVDVYQNARWPKNEWPYD